MRNPFKFGKEVGSDAFCNRARELADISRAMQNSARMFIYGERRLGKTSLVKLALAGLPQSRFVSAYISVNRTYDFVSFATAVAASITRSLTPGKKVLDWVAQLFKRLAPSFEYEPRTDTYKVTFGVQSFDKPVPHLEEVLQVPAKISQQSGKRVVIVFDEFQRILEYDHQGILERLIREIIQTHQDVAYIFTGSQRSFIRKMFLDESRPLYRSADHYRLGMISNDHWKGFIRHRFTRHNKVISDEIIELICKRTQGHPYYTQNLCYHVWELVEPGQAATLETVHQAVEDLLTHESTVYITLWESLTVNQRRFLKALASEPERVKVFSSGFLRKHRLGSASSVQRIVDSLYEKDILDRSRNAFIITDRFLRIWIEQTRGRVD